MFNLAETTIVIDSVTYTVPINKLRISGRFLYKFFERTISGDTKSEAIGFFENQSITFKGNNLSDFRDLYQALSTQNIDGNYNKTCQVFSPLGVYNFEMYPDKLDVEMVRQGTDETDTWWGEMTVNFTATGKVR